MPTHHALPRAVCLFIVLLLVSVAAPLALAQDAVQSAGKAERTYLDLKAKVDTLKADLASVALTNSEIETKRTELETLRADALAAQSEIQRPLSDVQARLTKLGDAPAEGQAEADGIAQERATLTEIVNRLAAVSKQLEVLTLEAAQLSTLAGERQRRNFVSRVFERSRSVVNPILWLDGIKDVPEMFARLGGVFRSWWSYDSDNDHSSFVITIVVLSLTLLAVLALWMGWNRPVVLPLAQDAGLRRMWRALRVAAYSFIIVIVAGLLLQVFGDLPPRSERLVDGVFRAIVVFFTATALIRGVFRPADASLRLVNMDTASAAQAMQLSIVAVLLVSTGILVEHVASATFMPVEFTIAWSAGLAIFLVIIIASLMIVVRKADPIELTEPDGAARTYYFGWMAYGFHVGWLMVLVVSLALIGGYVALAHYLTTRIVLTASLVVFLVLVHHFVDALVRSSLEPDSHVGQFLRNTISLGDRAINRLGLLFSSIADVALVLLGIPLILIQWTLTWVDFRSWLTTAFFGFKIGDITIEPASIVLAITVLITGIVATRLVTAWLNRRVLARTAIDAGVRNSISTGTRYAGFLLAGGLALTSAGLDFSNLAIVVGALGVGIGFGLQSIVNNFVSGLILLAERPIKVGDWISASGGEGIVKRINVRSTEIETFDRCSVIVPNSNLIAEPVNNWYHNDLLGRVRVSVGVAYGSDPDEVKRILLECGQAAEHVVPFPEPSVLFQNFGASSLDFDLRVFIGDVAWVAFVASDLRFRIYRAFKEAGIEIPFPQQDIHVKELPPVRASSGVVRKPANKST